MYHRPSPYRVLLVLVCSSCALSWCTCDAALLAQQKFHKITQAYYRGSHGIVLVYDISDPETLDNTAYWMKSIRETAGSTRVQICLVGNKVLCCAVLCCAVPCRAVPTTCVCVCV